MYLLLVILSAWPCALWGIIHNHFAESTLVGKKDSFWNPEVSRQKKKILKLFRWDAETLMPVAMIFLLIAATVFSQIKFFQINFISKGLQLIIALIVFLAAYNIILRRYLKKTDK